MRKSLIKEDIIQPDGSLNLKYFNVKKGQYWSARENELLIKGVLKYGPTQFKEIKINLFEKNWTETEIRLRICRLLKQYNLTVYKDKLFVSAEEIFEEAKKNKEEAIRTKKCAGGVLYNPPADTSDEIINSFFNKKKPIVQHQQ